MVYSHDSSKIIIRPPKCRTSVPSILVTIPYQRRRFTVNHKKNENEKYYATCITLLEYQLWGLLACNYAYLSS